MLFKNNLSNLIARQPRYSEATQLLSWIFVITALRVFFMAFNGRELMVDEAQYWAWSQKLAWGYHSKPPMIAWLIATSTHFLGHSEFAIRFFSPFSYAIGSYFVFLTAKEVYDLRSAFWAGLSWLLLPAVSLSASIISTDPFLLMFEAIALYCFVRALKQDTLTSWLYLGLFLGLSLLCKYTALLLLVSPLIFLAWSKRYRPLLAKPGIYLALTLSLLLLLPNFWWNMQHHFLSIQHVVQHNIALDQASFHPLRLLGFWAAQVGIAGPFFLLAFISLIYQYRGLPKKDNDKLWLSFILPIFCVVSVEEFLVHGYDNWAAIMYIPLVIWLSHYLITSKHINLLKWNLSVSLLILVLAYAFELTMHFCDWQLYNRVNLYKRQNGWHQTQAEMRPLRQYYQNDKYLLDGRNIFFKSLYYLQLNPSNAYLWNAGGNQNQYNLSTHLEDAAGQNFIFITNNPGDTGLYQHFQSHKLIKEINLPVSKDKTERLYWIFLKNYRPIIE